MATEGFLEYRQENMCINGHSGYIDLTVISTDGKKQEVSVRAGTPFQNYVYQTDSNYYSKVSDSVYYLNLAVLSMDDLRKKLPELKNAKAIICDIRYGANDNDEFINYLIPVKDSCKGWIHTSQIIYPDQENIAGYDRTGGGYYRPRRPRLDAKIIFITDAGVISYGETFMAYIEHYKLATIIGQPTAGTNGGTNLLRTPGGYTISFSGNKVVKLDGSQHFGIGTKPDIYVERTIQGIKEGRDEFLERAIQIARQF